MERNRNAGGNDSRRTREAFVAAASVPDARIDHWIDAVPGLLSESNRRRRAATQAERISSAGRYWIPRLAPVTALLVAIALIWSAGSHRHPAKQRHVSASLDRWLVTGSDSGAVSDPLLKALAESDPAEPGQ